MSVINKVLRDLDKRQSMATASPVDIGGVRSGTTSVTASERSGVRTSARPKTRGTAVWVGLLLALLGGGALWQTGALSGLLADGKSVLTSQVAPSPITTATPAAPASVTAPLPVERESKSVALAPASRFDSTLTAPKNVRPTVVTAPAPEKAQPPVAGAKVVTAPAATDAPMATVAPPPIPAVAALVPVPTAADLAQKQQLAGRDALAHAQTLWNGGSRDAAVDMLQQAVASAEGVATSTPSAANTQTLVLLVREFGRMQLSEGRAGVVWETLTRLEPVLHDQPEMWALRANAAQRMGRHQDSVLAYMTALQSRPNEQRWLLGTAVSLAALGQTTSATEMAEKARAAGPISKEVQTYLRQMGVPLKE